MKNAYWYGYLEAGAKSSFVARDINLDTGNPQTIYLFNMSRGEFKEYKLDIVKPKLRELSVEESKEQKALEKKFKVALSEFKGRSSLSSSIPETTTAAAESRAKKKRLEEEIVTEIEAFDDGGAEEWDESD